MNLLNDILIYIRRIIKSPSDSAITDQLLIDYVNRFWIMDVDARLQLFDLKNKFQFITTPAVDKYNIPLYSPQIEPGGQLVGMYPVYQGITAPVYINGIQVPLQTQKNLFYNIWPNINQNFGTVAIGNGTVGPYTFNVPVLPTNTSQNPPLNGLQRGHVDISGIIALGQNIDPPVYDGTTALSIIPQIPTTSIESSVFVTSIGADDSNIVIADSGVFLSGATEYGLLMVKGPAPFGNQALSGPYSTTNNTVNYLTGAITVTFPQPIPAGNNINVQAFYFQSGLPRGMLFYNNTITLRTFPDTQYLVECDAYLSPAAFLNSGAAIQFGYMAEYIARGATRKILADTGDIEQFQFQEQFFREQEMLVWKRSQRQWTETRTETIYSQGFGQAMAFNNIGGGTV